ncbi:glycosyltransferase family 39 protein [Aureisphaera galaxeae]|uniref:ArnT family glycosyltransferase n=1 Tax=Aureisphaera galaxeae TaxID=1538023 RepID=UPI002350A915|nr:glycosyltransferase family 39 protein [Aureisphaera galaxeae]MDC8006249.1 glycosyltransferase family 39 protein [Aureisphaera galaxeae]
MKWGKHKYLIWLLIACAAIFLSNLAVLHVNIMEARNFITAREMIQDGNWLLTTLNGYPRYQKPPLPTWITAGFAMVFGLKNIIALRLPAALMAILLIFTSYKFVNRLTDKKYFALISGLIMATSFYIVSAGRDANWDIYTHGFMMVCIYQLYLFFTSDEKKYPRVLIAALFFGASFMSKGPVSFYALLLPFLISFGIVYKYKGFKKRIVPLIVFLVVSLLLSGWWHWYTYTFDPETVAAITKKETSNWTGYNVRPFYYYWSFFTQSGVWTLPAFIALLYPYLKNRVFDKKAYLFSFLWTMGSVVLLSIIPEKKSRYLLPVLIPMAINTAFYIEYIMRTFSELKDKRQTIPVYFNFGLIATIGVAFPIGGYFFLKDELSGKWFWFLLLSMALCTIGILMFKHLFKKRITPVFFLTIAFIASIMCFGMPMARTLTVNPEFKGLSKLNDWQQETSFNVYEYAGFTPELIWDYGKPIKVLKQDEKVTIPAETSFGLLVAEEHLKQFQQSFPNHSFEKITRYDMNPKGPGQRSHRPRLWRDLYLVTKK